MAIFEYRCIKCGNIYEELVFGDREKKIPCPKCGSASEKIPSVIGGISMGGSSGPSCSNGSCPGAASGACSAGGGCPGAF